jgi:hypothetical protein
MTMTVHIEGRAPLQGSAMAVMLDEGRRAATNAVMLHEAEWKRRAARARRTGTMLRSITHRVQVHGHRIEAWTGTNLPYARYLEEGTGLYGPRHRWIVPVRAKALRFTPGHAVGGRNFRLTGAARSGREAAAGAQMVYATRVRGIRPRRFARDAALVVTPRVHAEFQAAGDRIMRRLAGA